MRSFFLAPAVALVLSGCASVVPTTIARLSLLDPFTADPAGFSVALETDDGLSVREGTAQFIFIATHSPRGEIISERVQMVEDRSEAGRLVYSISPEGVEALRAMQVNLRPWKETSDGNSSLTLTVEADGCLVDRNNIPENPRVSIFLQLSADTPMRPLVRNGPLAEMFDVEDLAELPQCSG